MRFSMFLFYFILLYIFHPVFFSCSFVRFGKFVSIALQFSFYKISMKERHLKSLDLHQIANRFTFVSFLLRFSISSHPVALSASMTYTNSREREREIKLRRIMQPNKKCHCQKCSTISIYDDVWKNSELIKQFRNKFSHREYKDHSNSSINSHFIFMNTETFATER